MVRKDQQLGTERIGRLLARMSIPAIIGMLVGATYNVVDTIFIGRGVGPLGIGGLAVSFPMQMIVMAVAQMIGIGAASVISRNLGSGDRERAYRAAGNVLSVSIGFGAVMMTVGLTFLRPILRLLGATAELLPYAQEYLSVIFLGTIFITFAMASNNIVRSEGNATVAMVTMLVGTGMNIVLDPIFIFALDLGIRGAAMATVISQFLSFSFLMFYFTSGKSSLKIKFKHLIPEGPVLKEIFKMGVTIFMRQFGVSIFAIVVNNSLRVYGSEIHYAVFGIVAKIMTFTIMPIM